MKYKETSVSAHIQDSLQMQLTAAQAEIARLKAGWTECEKRLRKYECHHGYRKDQSCISANCDSLNHTKDKL